MSQVFNTLTSELRQWIERQKVFFVATAPLAAAGHVNCSPKGCDTLRILDDCSVAYLDLTGSGIETTAHLQENGRIVVMFCAFDGPPKIVRLHGIGAVIYPDEEEYGQLIVNFRNHPSARAIIRIRVTRIADSCGHGVPVMSFVGDRDLMDKWAQKLGPDGLRKYRISKNQKSIDGYRGCRMPNQLPDPTSPSVTPAAGAAGAPSVAADR